MPPTSAGFLLLACFWAGTVAGLPARGSTSTCSADICAVNGWPSQDTLDALGQASGVDVGPSDGHPVVFHRGDRIWDQNTFDRHDNYTGPQYPIQEATILKIDAGTGEILQSGCSGVFYMPHMLTLDAQSNLWVTDVAMHQVFRIPPEEAFGGDCRPDLTLGTAFVNGKDDDHFCKPTSVAVREDASAFYVADGYCNSRVIKYELEVEGSNVEARKVWEVGHRGVGLNDDLAFKIPHALALCEPLNLLCVADREHGRIQCLDADTGDFVRSFSGAARAGRRRGAPVYGLDYAQVEGRHLLYAVTGKKLATGLIFDLESPTDPPPEPDRFGFPTSAAGFKDGLGFSAPHDFAAQPGGRLLYETELSEPFRVYKLEDNRVDKDAKGNA